MLPMPSTRRLQVAAELTRQEDARGPKWDMILYLPLPSTLQQPSASWMAADGLCHAKKRLPRKIMALLPSDVSCKKMLYQGLAWASYKKTAHLKVPKRRGTLTLQAAVRLLLRRIP